MRRILIPWLGCVVLVGLGGMPACFIAGSAVVEAIQTPESWAFARAFWHVVIGSAANVFCINCCRRAARNRVDLPSVWTLSVYFTALGCCHGAYTAFQTGAMLTATDFFRDLSVSAFGLFLASLTGAPHSTET